MVHGVRRANTRVVTTVLIDGVTAVLVNVYPVYRPCLDHSVLKVCFLFITLRHVFVIAYTIIYRRFSFAVILCFAILALTIDSAISFTT